MLAPWRPNELRAKFAGTSPVPPKGAPLRYYSESPDSPDLASRSSSPEVPSPIPPRSARDSSVSSPRLGRTVRSSTSSPRTPREREPLTMRSPQLGLSPIPLTPRGRSSTSLTLSSRPPLYASGSPRVTTSQSFRIESSYRTMNTAPLSDRMLVLASPRSFSVGPSGSQTQRSMGGSSSMSAHSKSMQNLRPRSISPTPVRPHSAALPDTIRRFSRGPGPVYLPVLPHLQTPVTFQHENRTKWLAYDPKGHDSPGPMPHSVTGVPITVPMSPRYAMQTSARVTNSWCYSLPTRTKQGEVYLPG